MIQQVFGIFMGMFAMGIVWFCNDYFNSPYIRGFHDAVNILDKKWISCDKELPKEDGQYIATVKYKHVDGYEDVYSETCEWYNGHFDTTGFSYCGEVEKILAWMPLPEPFKGVTDGRG